ncbi:hypothetical protein AX16_006656 [Volvariella volvacea WC 439]|nr:hypothetical protein AX16_006656 [Volvariella volvacea WC 439]
MEALIAKADAIQPRGSKHKGHGRGHGHGRDGNKDAPPDPTLQSIVKHTSLPRSLDISDSLSGTAEKKKKSDTGADATKSHHAHIANKKLRTKLDRETAQIARGKALVEEAGGLLALEERGGIEVEGELERTWRIGQGEIVKAAGAEAAKGRREIKLDGGPYQVRYTRNGRHLAIAGRTGHVATFDWQTGTLHSELQLKETCRDVTFLQDHSYYAVAQKKYVYIYDRDGVELHCLKSHIEPTRLEFLPYHWLLASVGNAGYLKYQDTSTGQLITEHRTKLGSPPCMTQNPHTAVIYLGHNNGTVTLWTPNLPQPAVQVLAHMGPVVSVSVDPSSVGGRYMATAGRDGTVKIWDCRNWKGAVREWSVRGGGDTELEWSQKGNLAVGSGGTVNIYSAPSIYSPHIPKVPPPLYLTHPIPHRPITSLRFGPFQDTLTVGHATGISSLLVPGSGEPNFDSSEADPFENKKARREREVKALLDKIQPDMISLDPGFIGSLAPPSKLSLSASIAASAVPGRPAPAVPFARLSRYERLRVSGKADVTEERSDDEMAVDGDEGEDGDRSEARRKAREEREKRKMRGKGKSLKRYLRKQRKNVIDPTVLAIRAKVEKQKEEKRLALIQQKQQQEGVSPPKKSALDRFKNSAFKKS